MSDLTKAGDQAEWITHGGIEAEQISAVPHEVLCAAIEAQDAAGEWTLARQAMSLAAREELTRMAEADGDYE